MPILFLNKKNHAALYTFASWEVYVKHVGVVFKATVLTTWLLRTQLSQLLCNRVRNVRVCVHVCVLPLHKSAHCDIIVPTLSLRLGLGIYDITLTSWVWRHTTPYLGTWLISIFWHDLQTSYLGVADLTLACPYLGISTKPRAMMWVSIFGYAQI